MADDISMFFRGPLIISGALLVLYTVFGAVRRLYFSPVAGFPGPRLAALTFWYEFYYDVIRGGQYDSKLLELHKQNGPIIRINPFELHILDSDFYDKLYVNASERRTDKWWWSTRMFGPLKADFATVPHDLHRRRRAVLAPFFSRASVRRHLEPMVRSKVEQLSARIAAAAPAPGGRPQLLALGDIYAAFTFDVISAASYPDSFCFLDAPELDLSLYHAFCDAEQGAHLLAQVPALWTLMAMLPGWATRRLDPAVHQLFACREAIRSRVAEVVAQQEAESGPADATTSKNSADAVADETAETRATYAVLHLRETPAPAAERSVDRITDQMHTLLVAGTLTTTHALAVTTFHVFAQPTILAQLRAELAPVLPSPAAALPPVATLEALPYLTAVIYEGLRVANGVPHRLQRVAPDAALRYGDRVIPPGTPVSMSAAHLLTDPGVWGADAAAFRPERWLPLATAGARLQRSFAAFSRGSRACSGRDLAWAEMYLVLAAVVGRFGGRLDVRPTDYETDVKLTVDAFVGLPKNYRRGLRVLVGEGAKA